MRDSQDLNHQTEKMACTKHDIASTTPPDMKKYIPQKYLTIILQNRSEYRLILSR